MINNAHLFPQPSLIIFTKSTIILTKCVLFVVYEWTVFVFMLSAKNKSQKVLCFSTKILREFLPNEHLKAKCTPCLIDI